MVSMVVWCGAKYPPNRLLGMLLSLERQTFKDWECVVQVSKPAYDLPQVYHFVDTVLPQPTKDKISFYEYPCSNNPHWGYERCDEAFQLCEGCYIGRTSDDNWYAPEYFEQMVAPLDRGADLVLSDFLCHHRHYDYVRAEPKVNECDLGCWLARAELVKSTPWPGTKFTSDGEYVEAMAAKLPPTRIAHVRRPLYVHN